jgi:hypothetical protein
MSSTRVDSFRDLTGIRLTTFLEIFVLEIRIHGMFKSLYIIRSGYLAAGGEFTIADVLQAAYSLPTVLVQ